MQTFDVILTRALALGGTVRRREVTMQYARSISAACSIGIPIDSTGTPDRRRVPQPGFAGFQDDIHAGTIDDIHAGTIDDIDAGRSVCI